MFREIEKRKLLTQIVESEIENAIRNKILKPGDKLPSESQLCKQFNVSRTVIREALGILSGKGLITVIKGKGIFVNELTIDIVTNPLSLYLDLNYEFSHILDVVKTRLLIEPVIGEVAALNRTEENILKMQETIDRLANTDDQDELSEIDMEFHFNIAKATQNTVIVLLVEPIYKTLMPKIKRQVYETVDEAKSSAIKWHTKILKAIKEKNPEKTSNYIREHLKIAERHAYMMVKARIDDKIKEKEKEAPKTEI
jgi:GntR family transcriptional repressor for pyruvate dehydrogenase complex